MIFRGKNEFFTPEGRKLNKEEVDSLNKTRETFYDILEGEGRKFSEVNEKSGDFFRFLHKHWSTHLDLDCNLVNRYYKTLLSDAAGVDGQCHLDDINGTHYFQYKELVGGHNVFSTARGYSSILEHFTDQIESCCVKYNSTVDHISWKDIDNDTVDVRLQSEGTTRTLTADIVVCTLPLGYLKAHHRQIFSPSLPMKKVDAMNK